MKKNYFHYKKLEIDQIIASLKDLAILPATKEIIDNLEPMSDLVDIDKELHDTDEALVIVSRYERAPLMISSDYGKIINLARKGAKLTGVEIYETARLFKTIKANQKLLNILIKEAIPCRNYASLIDDLVLIDYLDRLIIKSVDENGLVLDDASPVLKTIRTKLRNIDNRIKSKCQEIMSRETSKLSQATIVIRNDAYCLPVKVEYKNSFKGIIQDMSSSMQTVYIEPEAVATLSREKNELYHQEHEEIEKILKVISGDIQAEVDILANDFEIVVKIDFLFSKAVLASSYQGACPHLNTQGTLKLVNARHPLLKVAKVIPNNVTFGKDYYGIIITGPNTGGKTVLLKTVGLLVLMVKFGLLIPADASSDIMIYDDVFCDIGDDQSIQNNLSTFSSHMGNIVKIINNVTPNSLALFDEIGAGTDPVEGSNLAIAILKYLLEHHVSFITTTHYSALKALAFEESRIINASMEFDQNTLSPTYRLLVGVSGSSNAFNIATRLGLKAEIIKHAEELTITNDDDVRKLIMKLEQLAHENAEEQIALQEEKAQTTKLNQELSRQQNMLDHDRELILKKAHQEATSIVEETYQKARGILDDLQKLQNRDVKLHEIIDIKRRLDETVPNMNHKNTPKVVPKQKQVIKVDSDVFIKPYEQYGVVTKVLKNNFYEVAIGNISVKLAGEDLTLVEATPKVNDKNLGIGYSPLRNKVSLSLDLRGARVIEARDLLDKYIDDLVCAGIKQATIIHGYGTGAIREYVQNYLKSASQISTYRYGGEGEGGFGVTVVTLK